MRVGITATRQGLTDFQRVQAADLLRAYYDESGLELHHGMCVGGDFQVHNIARDLFGKLVKIHGHPGNIERFRAECDCDEYHRPRVTTERNRVIVDSSLIVLAFPGEDEEVLRSGTWMTIRYAKKKLKLAKIVHPSYVRDIAP